MIDWESNKIEVLLNPRHPPEKVKRWTEQLNEFPSHIWIQTSGSSGKPKFVALSKEAVLISAQAVNTYLQSDSSDIWINALPNFHVGGLGIEARAYLTGAQVIYHEKWNPEQFIQEKGTLSALVPTQLFDLVQRKFPAPKSLRAVVIGGGSLDSNLFKQAQKLGWPILQSYGLSECASQVATGNPLNPLSHIELKISDGFINIKSRSLLTTYAYMDNEMEFVDPKVNGWFQTEDRGEYDGKFLKIIGRSSDFIKIGGESVNLQHLKFILNQIKLELNFKGEAALFASSDPRLGSVIHIAISSTDSQSLIDNYNKRVLPFERIREVHQMANIPWKSCLKQIVDVINLKKG